MSQKDKTAYFGIFLCGLFALVALIAIAVVFYDIYLSEKILKDCKSKGYEYYIEVGDYYNCCKNNILVKDNAYIEKRICTIGGNKK